MQITPDTLVSEILEACPETEAVFARHGVNVHTECHGCLDNPLDLCETMCDIADIDGLIKDLQALLDDRNASQ
ncbi:MAG: hypothetical protein ACOY94_19995 [Bacillota bacterium]